MSRSRRWAIRLSFYPTLWITRVMCVLRVWNRWDWVDDDVLLGGLPSRGDLARLRRLGVGAAVNFCAEFRGYRDELKAQGIEQLYLPTLDYCCPSESDLRLGVEFIRRQVSAGHKVFVHCKAGQGRSATLAVCYLMAERRITAAEAFAAVRAARPHVTRGLARRPTVRGLEQAFRETADSACVAC